MYEAPICRVRAALDDGAGDDGILRERVEPPVRLVVVVVVDPTMTGTVAMMVPRISPGGTPSVPDDAQPVTNEMSERSTAATAPARERGRIVMPGGKAGSRPSRVHSATDCDVVR